MNRGWETLKAACITVLGSGHAPFASGTWGSLFAVVMFGPVWLWAAMGWLPRIGLELVAVAGIVVASWLSVIWGPWAIERYGRKDPKQFTLDEFAGQWLSLLLLPVGLGAGWWALGFVIGGQFFFFRLFDVLKPPPARQAESLPAGWGVLVDDLFAGVYANIAGQLLWRLTPLATYLGVDLCV